MIQFLALLCIADCVDPQFLSQYPGEAEFLMQPLSCLEVRVAYSMQFRKSRCFFVCLHEKFCSSVVLDIGRLILTCILLELRHERICEL